MIIRIDKDVIDEFQKAGYDLTWKKICEIYKKSKQVKLEREEEAKRGAEEIKKLIEIRELEKQEKEKLKKEKREAKKKEKYNGKFLDQFNRTNDKE